ncbi:hypothetical protein [Rhodanobacter sp. MP7CTX1]|nr:hypothetical protein [Rhodanobacter sp. MP7CTX1]MBB6185764.1 tRNA U34 2-thiouridine synthase MnmA/TrmU [Rhodanobacter sp. MP7CTX1]
MVEVDSYYAMRKLAQDTLNVQGIFNNNYEDQGQRNAATLQQLVEKHM